MKDLIIVGAGPVGSHLAKEFAEAGKDVLVIERSDEVGKPLACSGHVSPDIWDFVPEDARDRLEQNRINGARFHRGGKEYEFSKDETVSYVIDRVELDKVKAEEAKDAGAEYRLDENVLDVNQRDRYVEIDTDRDSYRSKMVAGCDGASSTVRARTGLPEPDHFYQGILCFSDEDDGSDFVDVFLDVPGFFGWRIPRGDSVEYGAAVPKGEEPVKWLDHVLEDYDVEKSDVCAGAIPVGPAKKTSKGRVFLVGDAAAQTKPFTGGGIIYGMRAADIASRTVDVNDPRTLDAYEKEWRAELSTDIKLGRGIEKFYSLPSALQRPVMWFFQGEIGVHMDRPTSLFSREQLKSLFRR
ncbi:MAG: geranylgeranyl reductase family protein [Candidatus Nanohaloarchaea archaeon]